MLRANRYFFGGVGLGAVGVGFKRDEIVSTSLISGRFDCFFFLPERLSMVYKLRCILTF